MRVVLLQEVMTTSLWFGISLLLKWDTNFKAIKLLLKLSLGAHGKEIYLLQEEVLLIKLWSFGTFRQENLLILLTLKVKYVHLFGTKMTNRFWVLTDFLKTNFVFGKYFYFKNLVSWMHKSGLTLWSYSKSSSYEFSTR